MKITKARLSQIIREELKTLNEKIEILNNVNKYLRKKDNNVKQVTANFLGEQKSIEIIRSCV